MDGAPLAFLQTVVETLRAHRRQQQEQWLAFGLGRTPADGLVFAGPDGGPIKPLVITHPGDGRWLDSDCASVCIASGMLMLRCLIADGIDILKISRQLGHAHAT